MSNAGKSENIAQREMEPGYCSATCTDRACLQDEIAKPEFKTSDMFVTCNLPKRFEHPRTYKLVYLYILNYYSYNRIIRIKRSSALNTQC